MVDKLNFDGKQLDIPHPVEGVLDCLIVDKVFASCQQRECFTNVEADLCEKNFDRIRFKPGFIVPDTLIVTDLPSRPNFRRVRFTVRVPYQVLDTSGNVITEEFLPDIYKDVILYIPDARDEFVFRIVIETSSVILSGPDVVGNTVTFTAGVFLITKVVGTVQLQVLAFGYCEEPPYCEEYSSENICELFDYADFPEHFFPPQLNDICPK